MHKPLLSITLCFLVAASTACGKDANNGPNPDPDPDTGMDMGADAMTDGGGGEDVVVADMSDEDVSITDTGVDAADAGVDMAPEEITIDEFWEQQAAAVCDAVYGCPGVRSSGLFLYAGRHHTVDDCRESEQTHEVLRRVLGPTSTIQDSVADGHVTFDGVRAAECVRGIETWLCDPTEPPTRSEACSEVFVGTREDGESCRRGECVEGLRCNTGTECFGVCEPVMTPCGGCADDEYCDSPSGDCEPRGDSGAPCEGTSQCQDGLVCDAPSLGVGTCIPPGSRSLGDVCFSLGACGDGLFCKGGECERFFVVGEGFACGDLPAAQACAAGLYCDIPSGDSVGVCTRLEDVGDTCNRTRDCVAPTSCDSTTDTCTAPKPFGSVCTTGFECESVYCSPSGSCGPWPTCDLP